MVGSKEDFTAQMKYILVLKFVQFWGRQKERKMLIYGGWNSMRERVGGHSEPSADSGQINQ